MNKRKILITGSAGFMGSYLCDYIIERYGDRYEVHGIDDLSGGIYAKCFAARFAKSSEDFKNQ